MERPFCGWARGGRLAVSATLSCLLAIAGCSDDDDATADDRSDVSETGDEDEAQDEGDDERAPTSGSEDDDEAPGRRDAAIDAGRTAPKDSSAPALDSKVVSAMGDGGSNGALDGKAADPDSGASEVLPREDLGEGDGTDVLMIGDSWMSLGSANSGIQGGVLKASGQPYRTYGVAGATVLGGGLLGGFLTPIPTQYQNAVRDDPDVKTVIMTGGGNDILQSGLEDDCDMEGEACGEQVTKLLDTLSMLWAEMAADGVQDVIYILYATPEGESIDFTLPDGDGTPARCAKVPAPLRCHIQPTVDIVMGDIPDGTHPSQTASDRIGEAVHALMAEQGMRR